ncbi:hypothetical protein [Ferroacidibacillus organovorans]|uniref:Uncharacterized protein n=1 Tax=Ferroacidibacillus organovorans TaxID=1765683 RepID=A0A1V4EV12_9BACL|nr:hypothetical protein [Ferroacidibacillus organovorans]OPG16766.1 hypothetical protein B2M26_05255 [Ferroacidibacillus organovorans]
MRNTAIKLLLLAGSVMVATSVVTPAFAQDYNYISQNAGYSLDGNNMSFMTDFTRVSDVPSGYAFNIRQELWGTTETENYLMNAHPFSISSQVDNVIFAGMIPSGSPATFQESYSPTPEGGNAFLNAINWLIAGVPEIYGAGAIISAIVQYLNVGGVTTPSVSQTYIQENWTSVSKNYTTNNTTPNNTYAYEFRNLVNAFKGNQVEVAGNVTYVTYVYDSQGDIYPFFDSAGNVYASGPIS